MKTMTATARSAAAVSALSMGSDQTPLAELTLAGWAAFVTELVTSIGEPVVLVGHSRGGVVISEVAERAPEAISRLVYLAAFLVPRGKSMREMLALSEPREVAVGAIVMGADGISSTIAPGKAGPVFFNTTSVALQARAEALLTPEPMMSFMTPLNLTHERYGRVNRAYVECLQDNAVPIELQRLMQKTLPCAPVVTLDTDHSPFCSAPELLVRALEQIAAS